MRYHSPISLGGWLWHSFEVGLLLSPQGWCLHQTCSDSHTLLESQGSVPGGEQLTDTNMILMDLRKFKNGSHLNWRHFYRAWIKVCCLCFSFGRRSPLILDLKARQVRRQYKSSEKFLKHLSIQMILYSQIIQGFKKPETRVCFMKRLEFPWKEEDIR